MAINIKIGSDKEEKKIDVELNIRKTLDGDLMIFDHADIDIVIMLEKKKILTLPKELITDQVYGAQNRLFSYLRKKGIINFDSIQGGNVYGSLEAGMLESKIDGGICLWIHGSNIVRCPWSTGVCSS